MDKNYMENRLDGDLKDHNMFANAAQYPPPYDNTQRFAPHGYAQYPPMPYPQQSTTQTFDVAYSNWKGNHMKITDPISNAEIYHVDLRMRKPHIILKKTTPIETEVATANFHNFSSKFDLHIQGHSVTLQPKGKLTKLEYSFTYNSPFYHNQQLQWLTKSAFLGRGFEFRLNTADGTTLAQISSSNWGAMKVAKIEIFGSLAQDNAFQDEVLVGATAMVQWAIIWQSTAAGATNAAIVTAIT